MLVYDVVYLDVNTGCLIAIIYATNARVCYNGSVMQGLRVIKARACHGRASVN